MWAFSFGWRQSLVSTLLLLCIIIAMAEGNQGDRAAHFLSNDTLFHPNSTFTEGTSERGIMTEIGNRTYGIHIPVGISGDPPAVLFDFHGFDNRWQTQRGLSGLEEIADARKNFILVWPQASMGRTRQVAFNVGGFINDILFPNDVDDANFTRAIIEEIKNNMRINPRRIYAYGYSQGAAMTLFVSYKLNSYFAAIVANALPFNNVFFNGALEAKKINKNFHPIPVQHIHGYNDLAICWERWCIFNVGDLYHDYSSSYAKKHWHKWAIINDCKGEPVTLAENPPFSDHSEYFWIKAYRNCADGVEVIQILNDHNHADDLGLYSGGLFPSQGTNGAMNQSMYAERNLDFLFRWTLPDYVPVTVPEWWVDP